MRLPVATDKPVPPISPNRSAASGHDHQPLNAMDFTMLAVNEALQSLGGSGFETQALLQLGGRIDVAQLRSAISLLCRRFPVISSRLHEQGHRRGPVWKYRPGATCPLQETSLSSSGPAAVLAQAARWLQQPRDLRAADPISFHLLHLPDGRDCLLLQYNHSLMDNIAAGHLLHEIDQAFRADRLEVVPVQQAAALDGYLARFTRRQRLQAALDTVRLRLGRLKRASARLGRERKDARAAAPEGDCVQIATRTLGADEARRLERAVVEVCRFPSLSMALLAVTLQAIDGIANRSDPSRRYITGIGLDLGIQRAPDRLFQNLVSLVPICAEARELQQREQLIRMLNSQMCERLRRRIDLGVIELSHRFRPLGRFCRWFTRRLMRHAYSFWYGYFDDPKPLGTTFCGAELEELRFIGPVWPQVGFTLLVNRYQGRLFFQATYLPEVISETAAEHVLDQVVDGLQSMLATAQR